MAFENSVQLSKIYIRNSTSPTSIAENRCLDATLLAIARSNLHRWPPRRAWCTGIESEIGSFCLAERQVSPSAPPPSPPPKSALTRAFVALALLSRTQTRAQNFALFPYIRVLVRRIYQQRRVQREQQIVSTG